MMQLYVLPGSVKYDLPSLDAPSLICASYVQLLAPGEWELVESTETSGSPNGALPYLVDGAHAVPQQQIINHLLSRARSTYKPPAQATAFHSLLQTQLLPLVLHSLYSLPQNWTFVRALLADAIPFPSRLYRPEQMRRAAREAVEAGHPLWWGMGGEAEAEEQIERNHRRILLEPGVEGLKERLEEQRKESKARMKKTFGEGKIMAAARDMFASLETTLAQSTTPFFFSSPTATPLDAHLSALLSLVLYLPLPQSILSALINASFPRLWAHTALMRRTLWSTNRPAIGASVHSRSPLGLVAEALPGWMSGEGWLSNEVGGSGKGGDASKYAWFVGTLAVGLVGWGLGTGAIPLPGKFHLGEGVEGRDWADDNDDE